MTALMLNIGAGPALLDGYVNLDRKTGQPAFPLSYADGVVNEVRASHLLEHLSFSDAELALKEWHRVLKPGARLRIAVPDARKCLALADSDPLWRHYLAGGQIDADDFHRSAWDGESLTAALTAAGFVEIQPWVSDGLDLSRHKVSLNLQAQKSTTATQPQTIHPKVCALMSIPRLGYNDTWGCVLDALHPFGIPVRRFTGAFWGQCLQNALETCVAEGLDWVLTIDYDSLFTYSDVDLLLKQFAAHPELDALAALQSRRGGLVPLMTIKGQTRASVQDILPVSTAHFGLTLIRLSALQDIPKPWFVGKPDKNGSWKGDDKLDDDIWFWHQWRLHNKQVAVSMRCNIGHVEMMYSQYDDTFTAKHCFITDWYKDHGQA